MKLVFTHRAHFLEKKPKINEKNKKNRSPERSNGITATTNKIGGEYKQKYVEFLQVSLILLANARNLLKINHVNQMV